MKHSLYAKTIVLLVALLTLGCSDDNGVQDTGPTPDTGPPSDAAADGQVGKDALPDVEPADAQLTASFCGTLVDSDNMKVEGGDIIVCNDSECHTDTSGLTGGFCVNVVVPDDYVFHAKERKALGKHLGEVLFPLTLSAAEVQSAAKIDLDTVVMPLMGPAVKIDPPTGGTLSLGNGATLTVPAGAAVLPPLSTEAFVALADVPKAQLHPNLVASLPAGVDPVATFLLVPVEMTFTSPAAFALPAPAGLAAGTALDVYWVDTLTGKPTLHTDATVTAGGMITNTSGKGLANLGWLLFFTK